MLRGVEVEPLQEDIEHCIRELRVIIDNAKPSVLQFFGFAQAAEDLLERSVGRASYPLNYNFVDESDGRLDELPPGMAVAIYRIVQEGINNAISHANAKCITVELRDTEGRTTIVIEDDGHGLSPVPWRRTGGLTNMQTRASLIEAELRATVGANGQGTRLELILPARAERAKAPLQEGVN
jgi:signal transduction histidine kinase